ncbi:MAG: hypothetical protein U9O56_00375 [Campylobacterota bacterium]|nr:hypothetical protein [Campylobacterota bacterium]
MTVYNHLKKLHEENEKENLVIFVGAGISENYAKVNDNKSFPSWDDLTNSLKLNDNSTKDFLQIAQIYQDNFSINALLKKVQDLFPNNYEHTKIHEFIFELNPTHILTTNIMSSFVKTT